MIYLNAAANCSLLTGFLLFAVNPWLVNEKMAACSLVLLCIGIFIKSL